MSDEKHDDEPQAEPQVKPFHTWLTEQRRGALNVELGEALAEVSRAVEDLNKPGKVVLTISVKPLGTAQHTVVVSDDVKASVPQPEKPTSMFFTDGAGNLSREDPRQQELPLKAVAGGKADDTPLRKAGQG